MTKPSPAAALRREWVAGLILLGVFCLAIFFMIAADIIAFWGRVDRGNADDCWLWSGPTYGNGYGVFKGIGAHRYSKMIECGKSLSRSEQVLHRCDNPLCVNPRHLWVGTQSDNMRDMAAKGRQWGQSKTHCKHGHPFDQQNTRIGRKSDGRTHRICKSCDAVRATRYKMRQEAMVWS